MTTSAARGAVPEEDLRFSLDEPIEIDVQFCDLVNARNPNHSGPYELRFRGTRQPDGARVRGFVPLLEIEGPMIAAGVITSAVDTDVRADHSRGPCEVHLLKHAVTITKRRKGNGAWAYDVEVRSGTAAVDLKRYQRCLKDAIEAANTLKEQGYAVGSEDVTRIADSLFAVRTNRMEGGSNGTR